MNRDSSTALAGASSGIWFQRCSQCGCAPPRPCPQCRTCRGRTLLWERSKGSGRVVTAPSVSHTQSPELRLVIVKLDEGPLVDGWIHDPSFDRTRLGARVRHSAADTPPDCTVFEFAPDR